jgi:uncharacterized radical SAM superfamily Fe-S cluster-containing enzyme
LKLRALKNLKEFDVNTTLEVTLIKGVNDDQVSSILDFALKNEFVCELRFHPLCLVSDRVEFPYDKEHVLSIDDIKQVLEKSSDGAVSAKLFDLYNSLGAKIARIAGTAGFACDNAYFSKADSLKPFLTVDELLFLDDFVGIIGKGDFSSVLKHLRKFKLKYLKLASLFLFNNFSNFKLEKELVLSRKIFRININQVITDFSGNLSAPFLNAHVLQDGTYRMPADPPPPIE